MKERVFEDEHDKRELVIWSLFDSGTGSYRQAINEYFPNIRNYSIGIDKLHKNNDFINLDLADFHKLFGDNSLFNTLDKLPKPNIILASPPCESWSVASAMRGGNKCWVWESGELIPRKDTSILSKNDTPFKSYPDKALYTRINGELCAFNTTQIINRYSPKYWVIENPLSSKIWYYLDRWHGFSGIYNVAHYVAYDKNFPKKPTCFMSNQILNLKTLPKGVKPAVTIGIGKNSSRKQIRDYNERSAIPSLLVKDILTQLLEREL